MTTKTASQTSLSPAPHRAFWGVIREHIPNVYALIFGIVRVGTVTIGAMQFRGLPMPLTILLAIGIAGVALDMERRVAQRLLNPLSPIQSLVPVMISWAVPLVPVVALNSIAAFSVGTQVLQTAHTDAAFQRYW